MKLTSNALFGIGMLIIFPGVSSPLYIASIFDTKLHGYVLIPIFIGFVCIIYSLRSSDEFPESAK